MGLRRGLSCNKDEQGAEVGRQAMDHPRGTRGRRSLHITQQLWLYSTRNGISFNWKCNFYAIYSDPSSPRLSFSPPYRLNYMSSLSRFRKQRGEWSKQTSIIKKKNKKAQETYTQAETYTHKTHKNTKLETIIYKERLLRQNCPFTGNNHTTLLPARMRLLTLTGIRMGLESW